MTYQDNGSFSATIKGNYNYELRIYRLYGLLRYSCTCPVDRNCKHEAALFIKLNKIFTQLLSTSDYEVDQKLRELTQQILFNYYDSANRIIDIIDYFISIEDIKKINDYFLFLNEAYPRNEICSHIIKALCFNNSIHSQLLDQFEQLNDNVKKRIRKYIYLDNDNYEDYALKCFVNAYYKEFFEIYYEYCHYSFLLEALVEKAVHEISVDEKIADILIKLNKEERDTAVLDNLYQQLSIEDKKKCLENAYQIIGYQRIKDFDLQAQLEYLPITRLNDEDIEYILSHFVLENAEMANLLIVLAKCRFYHDKNYLLISQAQKLDESAYLCKYINHLIENNDEAYYKKNYRYYWHYQNEDISYKRAKGDEKAIFRYFDYSIYYEIEDECPILNYALNDKLNNNVLLIKEEPGHVFCLTNVLSNNLHSDEAIFFYHYLQDNKKDEIDELRKSAFQDILKKREIVRQEKARKELLHLQKEFLNKQIYLRNETKAYLEYRFDKMDEKWQLKLKVGINKAYSIKNYHDFFKRFENEESFQYGKNLELTHSLQNFNKQDSQALSFLLSLPLTECRQYLSLNNTAVYHLLTYLQNKDINFINDEYRVRLNEINASIYIDENYKLDYQTQHEGYGISLGKHQYLFIDNEDHCIDYLKVETKNQELFDFTYNNRGVCLKPFIEEFKDTIYSRYNNSIELAESIRDEFKTAYTQIEAYFDYQDKKIIVDTRYKQNENPVEKEELKSAADNFKIKHYENYLQSLGFENNEISDDSAVLSFFYMDFSRLKEYCNVYLSDSIQNKQLSSFVPASIRISYNNDMMQAFLQDSQYSDKELEEIILSIRRKKKYILLSGERIVALDDEKSKEFQEAVDDLGLDIRNLSKTNSISIATSLKAFAHKANCQIDDYLEKMISDIANYKDADLIVPSINGTLRPYQIEAYKWLKTLSNYHVGGILADDMGLGKTIEIITLLCSDNSPKPSLICGPKSLIYNWYHELQRFAPDLPVCSIYGNKNERKQIINNIKEDDRCIYITSYDSLRNDVDEYQTSFQYLIADEAQFIKNVKAKKTLTIKQIQASHIFALSGTPIENNIIDLWSIFDLVLPGYFENLEHFKSNYSDNEEFQDIIAKRIAPFILRRTKENVLNDLPEKYEHIVSAEMTTSQRKIYEAYRKSARDLINNGSKTFDILPYLMRLRQICVAPSTCIEGYEGDSGKLLLLNELIDDYLAKGHRLLIFSQFVKVLKVVEDMLQKKAISYYLITGQTASEERIKIADNFNNGQKSLVLVSLKAGGTGLNLTGADTVIHLDPWWNIAAENQASDRSHRIGQTRNVEVIRLICEDSIEQKVIELQNLKKDLIDRLIANDDQGITNASIEDIKFILK